MPLGSALEILVDHEPATRNLPRSARQWGQEVLCVEALQTDEAGQPSRPDAPVWRIVIEKRVP